jgi:hypothetical protein
MEAAVQPLALGEGIGLGDILEHRKERVVPGCFQGAVAWLRSAGWDLEGTGVQLRMGAVHIQGVELAQSQKHQEVPRGVGTAERQEGKGIRLRAAEQKGLGIQ